jgi:hypothetical protein
MHLSAHAGVQSEVTTDNRRMADDSSQKFWLLLDNNKNEAQFMCECSSCGAITTRAIEDVWRVGFVTCECGLEFAVRPDDLKILQTQAREMESKLAKLLTAN